MNTGNRRSSKKNIRILLAKAGLDGHDRGIKVVAMALRDAGMEVIYLGLRRTPEEIVHAALEEDVDVIGISLLSGAHTVLLPEIAGLMKRKGLRDTLLVAGGIVPEADMARLKRQGVAAIFTPGTETGEIVRYLEESTASRDSGSPLRSARTRPRYEKRRRVAALQKGDRRAAAQLISLAEDAPKLAAAVKKAIKTRIGKAHLVGITGAPGTGKSTLIHGMIGPLRKAGKRVGVLANDPTSPVTGGALLGDRIRMHGYSGDEGVFIRSMATRKGAGGLSAAAAPAASILDALGMDVIFIETTGVGQSETAVRGVVDTVVVVLTPQLGDEVQMMKAGVMEIGDIFVVNKGDTLNAARTAHELEDVLASAGPGRKKPAVIVTTASEGKGIDRLIEALENKKKVTAQVKSKASRAKPQSAQRESTALES